MPQKKHNWASLKQEYMQSDHRDVLDFIRSKLSDEEVQNDKHIRNGNIRRQTKGWKAEKEKMWEDSAIAAKEKMVEKATDEASELMKTKEVLIQLLKSKIVKERSELSMKDLKLMLDIIKTELGEPTKISQNTNQNTNLNTEATIFNDEESETIIKIIKDGQNGISNR